ncbi:MAG: Na/Pi cotransporter family protein [Firmicutes bacterium]|nr:Na/Pi cotransporter family protein [Bacillota bacterium]
MDIFSVFTLLGGVAMFLYGIHILSGGLSKISGGKLERTLRKLTSNKLKSIALGAGITIAIQSSSALTVMLVGLVNSGIMKLGQTVGVIMGSNIGTTLTAWIFSLSGVESSNFFIKMLKPTSFSPLLALVGVILIAMKAKGKRREIGTVLVGFAILMFGMSTMSDAVKPLADMPEFASILTKFNNPLFGVVIATIFTGIIQSSAASVGVLQALSLTGGITYRIAIPIVMGQNIGTCVTALISSIGANKNAKRVAVVHIMFNIIGTVICLAIFLIVDHTVGLAFADLPIGPDKVALIHSVFNVFSTVILLPFSGKLEKLAYVIVRGKDNAEKDEVVVLDDRLLERPAFAVEQCRSATVGMANLARETLFRSMDMMTDYKKDVAENIEKNENNLDTYEDKLGTYLIKISARSLSIEDSRTVSMLLQNIGDLERLGDHSLALLRSAQEMRDKEIEFSDFAKQELETLRAATKEIVENAIECFSKNDVELAHKVEPLEVVISNMMSELKFRHTGRLQQGICTLELGFVLSDVLNNFKRIVDHCENIAVSVVQINEDSFDTHEYLRKVRSERTPEYTAALNEYKKKYSLG